MPIQFLNCMAVWGKTKDTFLGDAPEPVCIPIHRILEARGISHRQVRDHFKYENDDKDDEATWDWTRIEVALDGAMSIYYVRHEMDRVMRAIAFLNINKDRTTCYVDDFTCKECG